MSKNKRQRSQQKETQYSTKEVVNPHLVRPVFQVIAQQSPFKLFSSAIRVSRLFQSIYTGKDFWLKIIKHHFPFASLENQKYDAGTNWGLVFRDIEEDTFRRYEDSGHIKLAFFYAKEGRLADFKKVFAKLGALRLSMEDDYNFTLTAWAARYHHQSILDHIFFTVVHRFLHDSILNLEMAIRCKRPMRSIKQFVTACHDSLNDQVRLALACLAASHGYLPCLQYLMPVGTEIDWTLNRAPKLLVSACESGNMDCVLHVLSLSPPKNHCDALDTCVIQDNVTMLRRLLGYGMNPNSFNYDSPLMLAVQVGRLACAQALLEAGADVNYAPMFTTILNQAVKRNNSRMIVLLLNHGASIHYGSRDIPPTLYVAVDYVAVDCLVLLLQYPVVWQQMPAIPANITNCLVNPDNHEILRLLLQAGLDPDTENSTMLYRAVFINSVSAVQQLVAANANPAREVHICKAPLINSLLGQHGSSVVKRFQKSLAYDKGNSHIDISPLALARIIGNHDILEVLEPHAAEASLPVKRLKR